MEGIGLKIQIRAMPSRGRARAHASVLGMLGIEQGDNIDLSSAPDAKPMTVSIHADDLVEKGTIRLDAADVEKLGLKEGSIVTVTKTPSFTEKIKSATSKTTLSIEEGVDTLSKKITGKK